MRNPLTKDKRARTTEAERREPVDWSHFSAFPSNLTRAARGMAALAHMELPSHKSPRAQAALHEVERPDFDRLDDDGLAEYVRQLRRNVEQSGRAGTALERVRARNAEIDAKAITEALPIISDAESQRTIVAMFKAEADFTRAVVEGFDDVHATLTEQLAEAEAEVERRQPKSFAAMNRELDELRRQVAELNQRG